MRQRLTLKNKTTPGTGTGWITIRSSAPDGVLPKPGVRISTAQARYLPKLVSPNGSAALRTTTGAHHYRIVGVEITAKSSLSSAVQLVSIGSGSRTTQGTLASVPHHIVIDQLVCRRERLSEFGGGPLRPIVVGDRVARDLVDPAGKALLRAQRVDMGVDFEEDILQDIFGAVGIGHPPLDELMQRAAEGLPELFACDGHRASSCSELSDATSTCALAGQALMNSTDC